jgi:hypothetical protein
MTIVVLGLVGGSRVALYIGGDLGLYLVVKMLRGDFWYWMLLGGKTEFVNSIIFRVLVKVITDFTSIVQFRHPNEVGGFYWAFGFVLTLGSLPLATIIAESRTQESEGINVARAVIMYAVPLTLLCFAVFLWNIERKYLGTFFSLQKGKDLTVEGFKKFSEDATKASFSLIISKHHWTSIKKEVRAWVEVNWERWEEEKPKWLDEGMRARIPVEYIPTVEARSREKGRRASVDAEAEGGLGGALRASIRRASIGLDDIDKARVVPIKEDN